MKKLYRDFNHFGFRDLLEIAAAIALSIWANQVFPDWQVPWGFCVVPFHLIVCAIAHIPTAKVRPWIWMTFVIDIGTVGFQTAVFYRYIHVDSINGEWTHWRKEELKCFALGFLLFLSFMRLALGDGDYPTHHRLYVPPVTHEGALVPVKPQQSGFRGRRSTTSHPNTLVYNG